MSGMSGGDRRVQELPQPRPQSAQEITHQPGQVKETKHFFSLSVIFPSRDYIQLFIFLASPPSQLALLSDSEN